MTAGVSDPRATLGQLIPLLKKARDSARHRNLRPTDLAPHDVTTAHEQIRSWARSRQGVDRSEVPEVWRQVRAARKLVRNLLEHHDSAGALGAALGGLHRTLGELDTRLSTAAQLYEFRRANGLSLQGLASRLDLTQPYLGLLERAAVGLPRHEAMQAVIDVIGLSTPAATPPAGGKPAVPAGKTDPERYQALALLRKRTDGLPLADIRFLAEIAALLAKRQHT